MFWITPYVHANFGDVEFRRGGLGLAAGAVGERIGFELDVDRHQHFYKDGELEDIPNPCMPGAIGACVDNDTDAWIVTADAIVPIRNRGRWLPYGSAGVGLIHAWVHEAGPYDSKQNDLTIDVGGGIAFRAAAWLALRADVQWYHAFVGPEHDGGYPDDFDFGRVALGATFTPFADDP